MAKQHVTERRSFYSHLEGAATTRRALSPPPGEAKARPALHTVRCGLETVSGERIYFRNPEPSGILYFLKYLPQRTSSNLAAAL